MDARHADVVEPLHPVAQELGGLGGLLGHGQIAGAGGQDDDGADAAGLRQGADAADVGGRVVVEVQPGPHVCGRLRAHPGNQHGLLAAGEHILGDGGNLLGGFAGAVNHLGGPLAEAPVVVHLGEAQIVEGGEFQMQQRLLGAEPALRHLFQDVQGVGLFGHGICSFLGGISSSIHQQPQKGNNVAAG